MVPLDRYAFRSSRDWQQWRRAMTAARRRFTLLDPTVLGHARIPIASWLRDNAAESLAHAQEAGQMIMRLHKRPALGIATLPSTQHNTIDEILTESIEREEAGVELYRQLLSLVKDKSVVLEEYAMRLVSKEAVHLQEMALMLMKRAPD